MSKLKAQGYSEKEIDEILGYSTKKRDYANKKIYREFFRRFISKRKT
jgi:hypothetical protein